MQIICKDGTTIQCRDFEAIDSGVLFYQETGRRRESEEEAEDEEEAERASGFVPVTELRFVLPDEMVQQPTAQRAGAPAQRGAPPAGAAPPQQGGMAQQQMQQFPGGSAGHGPESGGR